MNRPLSVAELRGLTVKWPAKATTMVKVIDATGRPVAVRGVEVTKDGFEVHLGFPLDTPAGEEGQGDE